MSLRVCLELVLNFQSIATGQTPAVRDMPASRDEVSSIAPLTQTPTCSKRDMNEGRHAKAF
jgi:hypothetical protein